MGRAVPLALILTGLIQAQTVLDVTFPVEGTLLPPETRSAFISGTISIPGQPAGLSTTVEIDAFAGVSLAPFSTVSAELQGPSAASFVHRAPAALTPGGNSLRMSVRGGSALSVTVTVASESAAQALDRALGELDLRIAVTPAGPSLTTYQGARQAVADARANLDQRSLVPALDHAIWAVSQLALEVTVPAAIERAFLIAVSGRLELAVRRVWDRQPGLQPILADYGLALAAGTPGDALYALRNAAGGLDTMMGNGPTLYLVDQFKAQVGAFDYYTLELMDLTTIPGEQAMLGGNLAAPLGSDILLAAMPERGEIAHLDYSTLPPVTTFTQ
jgi:hypothetical protein